MFGKATFYQPLLQPQPSPAPATHSGNVTADYTVLQDDEDAKKDDASPSAPVVAPKIVVHSLDPAAEIKQIQAFLVLVEADKKALLAVQTKLNRLSAIADAKLFSEDNTRFEKEYRQIYKDIRATRTISEKKLEKLESLQEQIHNHRSHRTTLVGTDPVTKQLVALDEAEELKKQFKSLVLEQNNLVINLRINGCNETKRAQEERLRQLSNTQQANRPSLEGKN